MSTALDVYLRLEQQMLQLDDADEEAIADQLRAVLDDIWSDRLSDAEREHLNGRDLEKVHQATAAEKQEHVRQYMRRLCVCGEPRDMHAQFYQNGELRVLSVQHAKCSGFLDALELELQGNPLQNPLLAPLMRPASQTTTLVTERDQIDATLLPNGQQKTYLVLPDEERAKGFVRPVRDSYKHVGIPGPRFPLRDLTAEEQEQYASSGYVKREDYPETQRVGSAVGRYWTQQQLDSVGKGCGTVTTMSRTLAETYARDPRFYSGTFCARCATHLPVGERGEFVWMDGSRVGT